MTSVFSRRLSRIANCLAANSRTKPLPRIIRQASTSPAQKEGLLLSDPCVKRLQDICQNEPDQFLRVTVMICRMTMTLGQKVKCFTFQVEGGGCAGFQYKFDLESGTLGDDDRLFERDGAKVVIDETSLEYLNGSTVDYHIELIRAAFRIIDNPLAEQVIDLNTNPYPVDNI